MTMSPTSLSTAVTARDLITGPTGLATPTAANTGGMTGVVTAACAVECCPAAPEWLLAYTANPSGLPGAGIMKHLLTCSPDLGPVMRSCMTDTPTGPVSVTRCGIP